MPAAAPPPDACGGESEVEAFRAAVDVSCPAIADLQAYKALLAAWSERFNLIGPSVLPSFWTRHALDSAQLLQLAPTARVWTDLGSGAGFPGLILAILLRGRDAVRVNLVESIGKRCRFLEQVVVDLELPAVVHQARAEAISLPAEVVTARACAPLPRLLGYAAPHLQRGAIGLFLKGREVESELTEARAQWRLDAELLPSLSDSAGRILKVTRLERA